MKKINFVLLLILTQISSKKIFSQRNPFKFNLNNNSETQYDNNIKVLGTGKIKNGSQFIVLTDGYITKSVSVETYFGDYKIIALNNFEITLSDSDGKIKKIEIKKPFNLDKLKG